ncbi:hypothetical protein [Streptomyces cyaneochromogenes]|uniref:hypothetical protein n=1 Tax=Streptomyces cyaneochromogenes TaxID=2496836 RepID=UPI001589D0B4|nr:hypothetical protein [Streptomyces cyaneochromogenes]
MIERLRSSPDDPACTALREVMQTPLMVAMLRTAYEDPDTDPVELLEGSWTERAALEAHLLDTFVPAAFRDDPSSPRQHARLAGLPGPAHAATQHQGTGLVGVTRGIAMGVA